MPFRAYFKGPKTSHLWGLFAGGLWSAGLIATFVTGGALAKVQTGTVETRGFAAGAAILAALWGLFAWREFRGGAFKIKILLMAMLVLWAVGAAMMVMAPTFGR